MHCYINVHSSKRPKMAAGACSLALILLVLSNGCSAIVKQQSQQQRNDDLSSLQSGPGVANGPQQHQSVSSPSSSSSSSSSYNNHQQSVASQSAPAQSQSYSSTISVSAIPSQQQQSQQNAAVANNQQQSSSSSSAAQQSARSDPVGYSSYLSASQAQGSGPKSSYVDQMSSASNQGDQNSYQAAANNVNMALANAGIFNPSSQSSGSNSGQSGQTGLNPLHYFYYPAKESSGSGIAPQAAKPVSQQDSISHSASNNYQTMAYPSYADQLNAMGSAGPEPAASGQDPTYLPQPSSLDSANLQQFGNGNGNGNNNLGPQQQVHGSQQQRNQNQFGDLNGYSSNQGQQSLQVPPQNSGISFQGPTASSQGSSSGQDYSNSHLGGSSGHLGSFANGNMYNSVGDLSTSNFGNNAGGLASVATYMAPNQAVQPSMGSQHDLFSGSLVGAGNGQQFNSAASQLTPASVSPPTGSSSAPASSLFNSASSLFGSSGSQGASSSAANSNNLFANQQYLNSFFTPQQLSQLTGQQSSLVDSHVPSSSVTSGTASGIASTSNKRFGISSFIMPMLALAGLSLLIPTMSNIGTAVGRKKRSVEDKATSSSRQQQIMFDPFNGVGQIAKEMSIGEYMDKIERYYSIYKNAVESDDCMNRLICEFGDAVKDITGKSAVVTVIEKLVPTWMTGKVHLFKEAALDSKEGKERCKKYVCQSSKVQHQM